VTNAASPPEHRRRPALVLDAELRQSLVTARVLDRAGIRAFLAEAHPGAPAFASRCGAGCALLPDPAHDREAFVGGVIELCESLKSPVVFTSHDGTIDALRARRTEVESHATLALASEEALALAVDKRATLAIAERLGIPVPPGRTVGDPHGARAAIDALGLPVVVKSAFSWVAGAHAPWRASPTLATNRSEALAQIETLIAAGVDVLVQKWLSGSRDAVSIFVADGAVLTSVGVRAVRTTPLVGGSAVVRETIPVPRDIGPPSEALVRRLGLEGFAQVEWRRDGDGRPFLMEVNPRLNASVELAVRAGVNIPLLLYRWAAGAPLQPVPGYRPGRRLRWLHGDVEWLREVRRHPQHPDAPGSLSALGAFIAEFIRPVGYDYWDRRDPGPAARIASRVARSIPGQIARRLRRHLTPKR
jgi:predicted ATP-grasp superfamily ATP-dependent carboligase